MTRQPLGALIAIANQKGGVGKTTATVHLAAALGLRGYRCLIIDLDPAAGATRHLGVQEDRFAGSLELLSSEETIANLAITENLPRGVHLVASRPQLSELDSVLSKFADRTKVLERPLARARQLYDFTLLDTCPYAGAVTTVAAYSAVDWILLSAFPHPLSFRGLTEAYRDVADVRRYRNPRLEILGVVFANVDERATKLRAELAAVVDEALPGRAFETHVSQAVLLPVLSGQGKTLFQLPRYWRYAVADQYLRLSVEVEQRVRHRDAFLAGTLPPPDFAEILREFRHETREPLIDLPMAIND